MTVLLGLAAFLGALMTFGALKNREWRPALVIGLVTAGLAGGWMATGAWQGGSGASASHASFCDRHDCIPSFDGLRHEASLTPSVGRLPTLTLRRLPKPFVTKRVTTPTNSGIVDPPLERKNPA